MMKKWGAKEKEHNKTENSFPGDAAKGNSEKPGIHTAGIKPMDKQINTILKGSKVTGDINVTCDMELSGDVDGNITSLQDANIVIKGTCKGNIETRGGNVDIRGRLLSGNIITGGNVSISGSVTGGEVKAKGKIYVNCEFKGKLEGSEIEIGPNAHIEGELLYKEHISILKGAGVEGRISRIQSDDKKEKKTEVNESERIKSPVKELIEAK